jgi:hypothetical protein
LEDREMYYVPDGTEQCGYYECEECGSRFLDLRIGPDEEMPAITESAKLIQMIRGAEEV